MKLPAVLEPTSKGTFRVRSDAPIAIVAEGDTEAEAVQNFRVAAAAALRRDEAKLIAVEIGDDEAEHPLLKFAGDLKGDPLVDEWLAAMAEYRRDRDRELEAE